MKNKIELFNKKGIVTTKLSRELLNFKEGDRIETIDSYTKKFECSRGVVQESFQLLESEKAINTEKRGVLGTFLINIDYKKLLEFASWRTLTGASPLPYTRRIEGFATGIYLEMEKRNIPFHFAYMQGAKNRAEGVLANKYNFATMAKGSALNIIKEFDNLSILMEFEPYTYLSGYALVFTDENYKDKEVIRVGLDPNSPDHYALTKDVFKDKKVEYVNNQYTRMIPEIIQGNIDVTIYNIDVLSHQIIYDKIKYEEVELTKELEDATRTVILVNKNEFGIGNVLKEIINIANVTQIMNEVRDEKRIPVY